MNSNYILPVSVAAAIHAVVLFGFTKSPRVPVPIDDETPRVVVYFPPIKPEMPEVSDPLASNSATKEPIVAPQPTSPEPLTLVVDDSITMRLPPIVPTIPGDSKTIIPQTTGIGDGTDWRSKIASSLELDNSPDRKSVV